MTVSPILATEPEIIRTAESENADVTAAIAAAAAALGWDSREPTVEMCARLDEVADHLAGLAELVRGSNGWSPRPPGRRAR